ncbi:SMI1/KNR4 family protein [Streptomyces halstedii]|uniref:SMI1/KNR4 family protein n=1 Tax=Streptomyces halstedii TaxID=1944 RepID=A0A6N9TVZ2_STRHA|nr:SMI1/KNR4 family protein [Streptomyces halstedii]NEA15558.1 SMI1/KNR4 family protein [Streptomyces halstedii]
MDASLAALAEILPPDLGADERIDRRAAEARWGTRLPRDYTAFMSVYGAGSFSEVGVLMPLPPREYPLWCPGTFEEETANARYTWEMEMRDGQAGPGIDPEHILAWGVTSGPDILCWLTADPEPDRWPVLVCGRHTDDVFTLFDCGMVEFLRRLVADEHDTYPLSVDIRGGSHRYVHWLEEQRRRLAEVDPDTGLPWALSSPEDWS